MGKPRSLKSNKRYKDAPRYPLIYDYEDDFKKRFKASLSKMNVELTKKMRTMLKSQENGKKQQ